MSNSDKIFMAFIVGAATGAISALLLAPETGEDTRKKLGKVADEFSHTLNETLESSAEKMRELADTALAEVEKYGKKVSESLNKG